MPNNAFEAGPPRANRAPSPDGALILRVQTLENEISESRTFLFWEHGREVPVPILSSYPTGSRSESLQTGLPNLGDRSCSGYRHLSNALTSVKVLTRTSTAWSPRRDGGYEPRRKSRVGGETCQIRTENSGFGAEVRVTCPRA